MTTLGALLVGLLLLVLLLGVLAWMQRRPRRGPAQPRTVADLVRMREAVRPEAEETEADAPAEPAADPEPDPVGAPAAPVTVAEPVLVEEAADRASERPDEREVRRVRVPVSPEDAAVEAPWARAARMVEPWRESGADASDEPRPTAAPAPAAVPRRPSLALVPSGDGDARPRSGWRTRPSTPGSVTAEPPMSSQAPANGVANRRTASAASTVEAEKPAAPANGSAAPADAAVVPADASVGKRAASAADIAPTAEAESQAAAPSRTSVVPADVAAVRADASAAPTAHTRASAAFAHASAERGGAPAAPAATALTADAAKPAVPTGASAVTGEAAKRALSAAGSTVDAEKPARPAGVSATPAGLTVAAEDRVAPTSAERPEASGSALVTTAVPIPSDARSGDADSTVEPADARVEIATPLAARAEDAASTADRRAEADSSAVGVGGCTEVGESAHGRPEITAPAGEAPIAPAHAGVEFDHSVVAASVVPEDLSASAVNGAETGRPHIVETANGHGPTPTHARVAGRVRRRPSATPAEQAAADLALLRTFGVTHRNAADEPDVELEGCAPDDDAPPAGNAQPISFRVLGRDGRGIRGATVTLLDDHGRETANTRTNADGHCVLTARHPGGYMLVTAAEGYQPGAITVAVTDEPVDAEIPLTRSASIVGSVGGEDGPIVGAQLALVQDGEIVDATESTAEGTYRFADLAAGEYGLSVTAHECEPAAFVLEVADEADLRQDVDLVPAGLPSDDVVTAHR